MAKFVTPAGVVVEMKEAAAKSIGYKPVAAEKKAPAKKSASSKSDN